jgi:ribonuclease P/MRP protein subunit POP5
MPTTLKPTLRDRNRYLVIEVASEGHPDRKSVVDAVWASLLKLYGEVGASRTSLWVMDWDDKSNRGVLKANHKSVETIRSAATMIREINGKRATVSTIVTCGTLKGARVRLSGAP